jgi:hypothetical protein
MDLFVATWIIEAELVLHVGQLQSVLLMHGLLYTGFCLDDIFLSLIGIHIDVFLLINCI